MQLVDTHQHLWDLRQFPCSWCAGLPALNRSFLLEDYLAAAHDTGIVKTVFVECDVDEPHALGEARYVQSLADRQPLIAGIVAAARPERAGFEAQLEELLNLPKLRGIRRVLHVMPDDTSQSAMFAGNVRRLAAHRLTFDLCVLARQLPLATALARQCPEVQFILDHCGVPDVKGRGLDPWRAHVRNLAALPNVACKVSGLVAYAAENWTVDDLRPWVEHVVECFGWDRLVWGGDWPVCTLAATLKQWVQATDALFASATPEQRAKVFRRNAERIYHLGA
jgi:predicted TIM-barrel fold metal-dependent hydrolase